MRLSTESIARACAQHPRRTLAAWGVVIVAALAAVALLLGGSLTTGGAPTNNPASKRARHSGSTDDGSARYSS